MLFDGNKSYSPLVCVGSDIPAGRSRIERLCVSPSGRVAIVERDPFRRGESESSFLERISAYIAEIRSWDCDRLDDIAADHAYRTSGQAARVIDIMARHGHLSFSDAGDFRSEMESGLRSEPILVVVAVDADEMDMRRVEYSQGALAASSLIFSFVEDGARKLVNVG